MCKNFFFRFFFLTLFPVQGFSMLCVSPDSDYQVNIDPGKQIAEVMKNLATVRFGNLSCNTLQEHTNPAARLACHSERVMDAGYSLLFYPQTETNQAFVKLTEIWIGGGRPLATLPCLDSYGTLEKRVLWLLGDLDVSDVDVATNGEIELNIRNTAGTGYEWELQQTPPPNTVTLLEGPVFIASTDLPGGIGVTRFRFKVDENPNRGFTLFFQLKRPWEDTPIKKFHVRFNAMRMD
jgi:hypothetical protein